MKYFLLIIIFFIYGSCPLISQHSFVGNLLKIEMDSAKKQKLIKELNVLFNQIDEGVIDSNKVDDTEKALSLSVLSSLKGVLKEKRSDSLNSYVGQLVNCFEINPEQYMIKLAFFKEKANEKPLLKSIVSLQATLKQDEFVFAIPLWYKTRYWKSKVIDGITYFYRGELNENRAKLFASKNKTISEKMGVTTEKIIFYIVDNYQELNALLGFEYELHNNGRVRDGHGVDAGHIFAIQNNEDFSHDIFHYYSSKINKRINRNWISEEGIAYLWGNAYYTDTNGEMINYDRMVAALKIYIKNNSDVSLLSLFKNDTKIFNDIAPDIKVRSLISAIICKEVEEKYGIEGINKLINAGSKQRMKSYFVVISELLSINEDNFSDKVLVLLQK